MGLSIVIAGGGSAGWILANLLAAQLPKNLGAAITLVESPNIPIIGVGEATVPSIRRTLMGMGLSEPAFMAATDATFKSLIRFVDWNKGDAFDHPFDRRARPSSDGAVSQFLNQPYGASDFADQFSMLTHLAKAQKAPKQANWPDFQAPWPYAYHLDAVKLAQYLTQTGVRAGVTHMLGHITAVRRDEAGNILSLTTDKNQEIIGDIFIDCTGFAARLIGQEMGIGVKDYGDIILCDRAVTMRVDYDHFRPDQIRPYTLASAQDHGWIWDINLTTRRGTGYVYASAFCSPEQAEAHLRQQEGDHARDLTVNHIAFATQKRHQSWAHNCVAVGLSDGFLEPLESSGLYMIEFAAWALVEMLPIWQKDKAATSTHFNKLTQSLYQEVLGFVNLHYVTSTRTDTDFWRATRRAIAPNLADKLALWRHKKPTDLDFAHAHRLFSLESHEYVLFGMGYCRPESDRNLSPLSSAQEAHWRAKIAEMTGQMPSHQQMLSNLANRG